MSFKIVLKIWKGIVKNSDLNELEVGVAAMMDEPSVVREQLWELTTFAYTLKRIFKASEVDERFEWFLGIGELATCLYQKVFFWEVCLQVECMKMYSPFWPVL